MSAVLIVLAVCLAPLCIASPSVEVNAIPMGTTCHIPDDISLMQWSSKVVRHARDDAGKYGTASNSSQPNYGMFKTAGSEPKTLFAEVRCADETLVTSGSYKLQVFSTAGQSGVLYSMVPPPTTPSSMVLPLIKFARELDVESSLQEEVAVVQAFPSWTPKTVACTAEISKLGSSSEVLGGAEYTFPILVKSRVSGFGLDDVLMTVASPKSKWKWFVNVPPTCKVADSFSKARYNAVEKLQAKDVEGKHDRRELLAAKVRLELKCLLVSVIQHCKDKGYATTDLKPANLMYGTIGKESEARVVMVDARYEKIDDGDRDKCWQFAQGSCQPTNTDFCADASEFDMIVDQWPGGDTGEPCSGLYWPTLKMGSAECTEWSKLPDCATRG